MIGNILGGIMKRFVTRALAVGLICGGAFGGLLIGRAVAADDAGKAAVQADRSLLEALGKSDKVTAGKLLDVNFAWTDVTGKTLKQPEVLANLKKYAASNQSDTNVQTHFYGQVETVAGEHNNARFLRVWVKQPAGW